MRAIVANLGWALMLPFALTVLFGLVVDHFIWHGNTPGFFLSLFGVTCGELVLGIILVVAAHRLSAGQAGLELRRYRPDHRRQGAELQPGV